MENKNLSEKSGALFVGMGIFLSRISGLVRVRIFAHYFGNSDAADAFNAALKIPNFLQNLFGEGVLSASFIPVYAQLITTTHNAEKDLENQIEASRVASIIGSLLFLLVSMIVLVGVISTPSLIDLIAPGFYGPKKELTIKLVQIIFPGTGLLVMSAWCLGILNSHRKFFLSYVAPVIWNISIILSMYFMSKNSQFELAEYTAWGLVVGSFMQFILQLPFAMKLLKTFSPQVNLQLTNVQIIIRNFFPVVISRGVVQLSAYIDSILASLLPAGAVSTLAYAQTLYLLPISLFGMSISASELPVMSSIRGSEEQINQYLNSRLNNGLKKIAFFIIPSSCAFIFLGKFLITAIFQSGQFDSDDAYSVWIVLIGSTIGLLASTLGRLYSSTYYSLKDTKTPLKFAFIRVILTSILGYVMAFPLIKYLEVSASWGIVALTSSAGISGWIEFYFLRKNLNKKIGKTGLGIKYQIQLWTCCLIASLISLIVANLNSIESLDNLFKAFIVVSIYGSLYFFFTYLFGFEESRNTIDRVLLKIKRVLK